MSEEAVIAALAVLGLVCELGGLILVVRGIRSDRRAARRVEEGSPGSDLKLAVGMTIIAPYSIEGREPTAEERLERLERRVNDLGVRENELREEVQGYVNEKVSHVERAAVTRDESLRHFLRELLEGDLSNQLRGVILFGVGALLATLSSVWDVLAG